MGKRHQRQRLNGRYVRQEIVRLQAGRKQVKLQVSGRHTEDTETERTSYELALQDYEQKSVELEKLKERISDKDKHHFNCSCFIEKLSKLEESDIRFNEKLWISLVDYVTVPGDDEKALIFHLKSGDDVYCALI